MEEKCLNSNFNRKLVLESINRIKESGPQKIVQSNAKGNNDKITWITKFKNIIKQTEEEKRLVPNTLIAYSKPMSLRNHLTNYKRIAKNSEMKSGNGKSVRCGKCGLCGGFRGFENMVKETEVITSGQRTFRLKQTLCCQNFGIYAAICRICNSIYVGQTCTSFKTRWATHRGMWRKMCSGVVKEERHTDDQALYRHFTKKHPERGATLLVDAYEVVFVTQPQKTELDIEESFWITKLHAEINVNKTFLPKLKSLE